MMRRVSEGGMAMITCTMCEHSHGPTPEHLWHRRDDFGFALAALEAMCFRGDPD